MSTLQGTIWILDSDRDFVAWLKGLLVSQAHQVRIWRKPEDLFSGGRPAEPVCLLLACEHGNGVSGRSVLERIRRQGWEIPTLILAREWTPRMIVEAIRGGAEDFIPKPCEENELMGAISNALANARLRHHNDILVTRAVERAATLTDREREVVELVVSGMLNKEVANHLGLAVVTVKVHRARAMRKLQAGNAAELARIAAAAGLVPHTWPLWYPGYDGQALAS
jgi:FixJ family two-component response regulator